MRLEKFQGLEHELRDANGGIEDYEYLQDTMEKLRNDVRASEDRMQRMIQEHSQTEREREKTIKGLAEVRIVFLVKGLR